MPRHELPAQQAVKGLVDVAGASGAASRAIGRSTSSRGHAEEQVAASIARRWRAGTTQGPLGLANQLELVGPQSEHVGFGVVPRNQILHVLDIVRINDAGWIAAADDSHPVLVACALLEVALDQRGQEVVAHKRDVETDDGVAEHRREDRDVLAHVLRHGRHRRDDGVLGVAEQIGQANGLVRRVPIPAGQLPGEPRVQLALAGGPVGDDELTSRLVPPPEPQLRAQPVDQQDLAHQRGRGGGRPPRVGPLRVCGPVVGLEAFAVDLQTTERADQLEVELLRDLRGRLPQRPLAAFALGIADLTDPPVLKHRHHRQQQQRAAGDQVQRQGTATSLSHRRGV